MPTLREASATARSTPKLDAEPLLHWLSRNPDAVRGWAAMGVGPEADACRRFRTIRRDGYVRLHTADRLCCLMGVHMAEVWPDAYWTADLGMAA